VVHFSGFNAKAIRRISVDLKAWTAATQSAAAWETMLAFQAKGIETWRTISEVLKLDETKKTTHQRDKKTRAMLQILATARFCGD